MLDRAGKTVLLPHPAYPTNADKQARLEEAIRNGYITRELRPGGLQAAYTLTIQGDARWLTEEMLHR